MSGGAASCLGVRQTLSGSHLILSVIANFRLPIANFNSGLRAPKLAIGNRQSAMISAN
jgi:hypothetical protein